MGGEGFNDKAGRAHARAQLRYPKPDIRLALESAHSLHRRAPGLSARRTFSPAQRLFLRRVLTGLGVLTLLIPELPGLLATLIIPPIFLAIVLFRLFLLSVAVRLDRNDLPPVKAQPRFCPSIRS
jgi:hypothetical protein